MVLQWTGLYSDPHKHTCLFHYGHSFRAGWACVQKPNINKDKIKAIPGRQQRQKNVGAVSGLLGGLVSSLTWEEHKHTGDFPSQREVGNSSASQACVIEGSHPHYYYEGHIYEIFGEVLSLHSCLGFQLESRCCTIVQSQPPLPLSLPTHIIQNGRQSK